MDPIITKMVETDGEICDYDIQDIHWHGKLAFEIRLVSIYMSYLANYWEFKSQLNTC